MDTRPPSSAESKRWTAYRRRFENVTAPLVKSLGVLGNMAESAEQITGTTILDDDTAAVLNDLGYRATILSNQITGVLLKKYCVQIDDDNNLNIVADQASEADIYPSTALSLGIAPILIAAGIFAVTLLIGADQANDALEKKAKIEATKLQQKLVDADLQMASAPADQRAQWEKWKKQSKKQAELVAHNAHDNQSWLQKFLGEKGATVVIASLLGIAALYALLPALRRN